MQYDQRKAFIASCSLALLSSLILQGSSVGSALAGDAKEPTSAKRQPKQVDRAHIVAKALKQKKRKLVAGELAVSNGTSAKPNPTPSTTYTALPSLPQLTNGKLAFDGAVRARFDANFNDANSTTGKRETTTHFGFDTLILTPNYTSDSFFASASYRFYGGSYPYTKAAGYQGKFGELNFLQYAYVGVHLSKNDTITVGLQEVPFGITPYFTTSFLETVGFTAGLEEVYNLGIKYERISNGYDLSVGYFPVTGGNYFGISVDSARYSTNIVNTDSYVAGGSNNSENNMFIGKLEKSVYQVGDVSATLGVSTWDSLITNNNTGGTGSKEEEDIHFLGSYGHWSTKALAARVDINPKNPDGQNQLITIGSFDASYNLATHGYFFSDEISYDFKTAFGPFSDIQPYVDYSAYVKDNSTYKNTQRILVGTLLTVKNIKSIYIYPEIRFGKNDPYTGANQFTQGLGAGGDDQWKTAININFGYYF